jgi:hypothetical protein
MMGVESFIVAPMRKEPTMNPRDQLLTGTQLTLFDHGLNAPVTQPDARKSKPQRKTAETAVVEVVRQVDRIEIIQPGTDKERPATAFEQESYRLYLQLAREVRGLSIKTATATSIVVALVIFGAQIDKTILRFLELRAVNHTLVIGVVGWITVAMATYTLARATFMLKKKHDCGVFYQRVLHFSSHPIMLLLSKLGTAIYVGLVIGAIALTLILAKQQMLDLIWFIIRNFRHAFIGPWQTEIIPAK